MSLDYGLGFMTATIYMDKLQCLKKCGIGGLSFLFINVIGKIAENSIVLYILPIMFNKLLSIE